MKCFSGIQRFIQLNNIDEKCLEKAAENLQIRKVKKNQYFLHEGEPTGFFAGLIKGKVSIRKTHIINRITNEIIIKPLYKTLLIKQPSFHVKSRRLSSSFIPEQNSNNNSKSKSCFKNKNEISPKKVTINIKDKKEGIKKSYKRMQTTSKINFSNREERNNKNYRIVKETFDPKKYIVKEEELFRQSEGYCFGEWALIYKEPRAASIYTLEDCIFFILDEVHFRNSFLKSLNNSEYSKKKFALQHFLPFDMMDERQLSIYKNIVPITCKRNQIIFEENDISNCIYLIYLGSFTLEKKFGLKQFKILDLGRGSIVGLESIFDGENSKYKCTLKLSRGLGFGLIFKLKINILRPYIINKMKISFQTNYNVFIKSLNDLYYKNILLQKKLSMERKGEYDDEEGNSDINFLNDNSEKINEDILKNDWKSLLNIGNESKYETVFKKYLKSRIHDHHLKERALKIYSLKQKIKMSELNSDDNINDNHKNLNIFKYFKDTLKKGIKSTMSKTSTSIRNKLIKKININDDSQINRYHNTFITKKNNLTDRKEYDTSINKEIKSINKILFKDKTISSNKFKLEKIKDNYNRLTQNLKSFKINKKLLYDNNILRGNIISNNASENQLSIEYSKNCSTNNNTKCFNKKNLSKINLLNKNDKSSIINNIIKNHKKENNSAIDITNSKLDFMQEKDDTILKEHLNGKTDLKHNYTYLSNQLKLMNSPIINDKLNRLFLKIKSPNIIKINKKKLNIPFVSGERKNHNLNDKELKGTKNLSFVNLKQKNLSLLNNNPKNIFMTLVNDKKRINFKTAKHQKNKIFNKKKIYDIIKKKYIHKNNEVNLSNGFSVSYFEKINFFNFVNYTSKNRPFPSEQIFFKESFDSGIFNIPLISSSIKLNK